MFNFGSKSLAKMQGVHPDLVKVMKLAITKSTQDFSVIEGVRTLGRQKALLAQRATTTLNSKHLPQRDGFGHAMDIAPYPLSWKLPDFYPIVEAVRASAKELGIKVRWGGSWDILNNTSASPGDLISYYSSARKKQGKRPFIDGPHFELV